VCGPRRTPSTNPCIAFFLVIRERVLRVGDNVEWLGSSSELLDVSVTSVASVVSIVSTSIVSGCIVMGRTMGGGSSNTGSISNSRVREEGNNERIIGGLQELLSLWHVHEEPQAEVRVSNSAFTRIGQLHNDAQCRERTACERKNARPFAVCTHWLKSGRPEHFRQ
jgi:hypothetical protein